MSGVGQARKGAPRERREGLEVAGRSKRLGGAEAGDSPASLALIPAYPCIPPHSYYYLKLVCLLVYT